MNYLNYNGKMLAGTTLITGADSRALRYGDGLFETMKYSGGNIIMADEHFARLWKGLQILQFDIPKLLTPELLTNQLVQLAQKNKHTKARMRLAMLRGDGGLYDAKNNLPYYLLQTWALQEEKWQLNGNGLQLIIYRDALKACDAFSNIKHNNYLPYFMGALFAKANQCNDAVILNQHQRICDSTIANIFLIKDGNIYTPALEEGCVAGIMRRYMIRALTTAGFTIQETAITEQFLLQADEIFLTNAIYNIRWVGSVNDRRYTNKMIPEIVRNLQQADDGLFC